MYCIFSAKTRHQRQGSLITSKVKQYFVEAHLLSADYWVLKQETCADQVGYRSAALYIFRDCYRITSYSLHTGHAFLKALAVENPKTPVKNQKQKTNYL